MKTLEITDEQYAVIQHLREEISGEVVGKYGFVRERDAVQFLIDTLDGETELDIELEADLDSSATDDVAASVGAAIEGKSTPDDLEEVSYVEDDSEEESETEPTDESDGDSEETAEAEPTADETTEEETSDSDDESDAASSDGEADDEGMESGDGSADDDDMLDEMMSLLETHDDKWEESSSADFRYSVELPDGTTEDAQTKDDVRALLFKNYR